MHVTLIDKILEVLFQVGQALCVVIMKVKQQEFLLIHHLFLSHCTSNNSLHLAYLPSGLK